MEGNVLLEFLDLAELVFSFATTLWGLVSKPLYNILGIDINSIPSWATPLTAVLNLRFAEFVIGAIGFFIVASIVKWLVGVIKGG